MPRESGAFMENRKLPSLFGCAAALKVDVTASHPAAMLPLQKLRRWGKILRKKDHEYGFKPHGATFWFLTPTF
jgi:hypothetical protein